MKKYPKIKRLGHRDNDGILDDGPVTILEKMDGANFRFCLDDGDLVFGSRNVVYDEDDRDSNFMHAIEYVRENINIERAANIDERYGPVTFYGEAMHSHTLDYEWDNVPSFLGFDIWRGDREEFVSSGTMHHLFDSIDLERVPNLYFGEPDGFDFDSVPDSEYRDGVAEGFVIKNYRTGQAAKVRSERFKEMHGGPTGNTPESYEPSDGEVLAKQFTTEARVIKMIQKMIDEGHTLEMSMMDGLWGRVFDDIIDEEYDTIFHGNYSIDTKQFRSEVASLTADHLQTYLHRPSDSVLTPNLDEVQS